MMDTVVRPAWPSAGYKGPSSVVDIATCTEKETERLDCWNPTLVFEYEKSRHSVENQFQMRQREELFPTKKITSGSPSRLFGHLFVAINE